MIDNDLHDFYDTVIESDIEKNVLIMLEEGLDSEEILERLISQFEGDDNDKV